MSQTEIVIEPPSDPVTLDVRAAVTGGIVGGVLFMLVKMLLQPALVGGSIWLVFRPIAAILWRAAATDPSWQFDSTTVSLGLFLHFSFAILFALLITFILHRWGLLVGLIGGALLGLALYAINYFTFAYFFPWFEADRTWIAAAAHIVFGAATGGTYEILEERAAQRKARRPAGGHNGASFRS